MCSINDDQLYYNIVNAQKAMTLCICIYIIMYEKTSVIDTIVLPICYILNIWTLRSKLKLFNLQFHFVNNDFKKCTIQKWFFFSYFLDNYLQDILLHFDQ